MSEGWWFGFNLDHSLQGKESVKPIEGPLLGGLIVVNTVGQVLTRLKEHGLKLNLSRCCLLRERVTYVGHQLSVNVSRPQQDKGSGRMESAKQRGEIISP